MTDPLQPVNPLDFSKTIQSSESAGTVKKLDEISAIHPIQSGADNSSNPANDGNPTLIHRENPKDQIEFSPPKRSILFPIDFEEFTLKRLPYTFSFAKMLEAQLVLLHVLNEDEEANSDGAGEKLKRIVQNHAMPGVPVKTFIEKGPVIETICTMAKILKVDMIVIPTHARGPIESLFLGSVTDSVIRKAQCPILLLR